MHAGVKWIALGWGGFIAENLVLSHNRQSLIEHFGARAYHGCYSVLSTTACCSIAYGYLRHGRGKGPVLWTPTPVMRAGGLLLQSLGFICLSQLIPMLRVPVTSEGVRCPIDLVEHRRPKEDLTGMARVTRHPSFWALGFIGVGTALTRRHQAEVLFYVMPAVFAFIGGSHQDYRFRRNIGGFLSPEVDAKTSGVPFGALLTGRQEWSPLLEEIKWTNALLAVIFASALALRRLRL
eukprot:NODE_4250_length_818_cov_19.526773_g4092_i0.p1 GENE.NODE_4250_length_818_cov_19.526773_g4092_i0~~NODE_4250_length_818_cov_19.526773_g4092_i0.p1  ORF type:complete len:258 (+),score=69.90 NODE_4250_length_818_cov_19.526773_g4092_i0:68-775(+)